MATAARETQRDDQREFDAIIAALRAEIANAAAIATVDSAARAAYDRQIRAMASELRNMARSGQISWSQAAREASEIRNVVMEVIRGRSTPVGRAVAESLKSQGKTLNEMIAKKTLELFPNSDFNKLTVAQQNRVYSEIVKSAGKSNPRITARMRAFSRVGRGLIFVSVAISVYNIAMAEDKVAATGREAAVIGAGIGGGVAGGALAGLACGPGAPVCVTVGAFVGGALAAIGVDYAFF